MRWRYDPIIITEEKDAAFHRRNFARIAKAHEGATLACIFSFLDLYGKVRRNLAALEANGGHRLCKPEEGPRRALAGELAEIGAAHGIRLLACCEDHLVAGAVGKARCVDPELLERIAPSGDHLPLRPTREECGCAASRDIGAYDTCPQGCLYCYANASPEAARRRLRSLDPARPHL